MPRRSARLQENGYYGSDGKPVICYKETMYRVFKKLKRGFHARFDTLPDTYLDVPLDEPSGTYLDVPLDKPSGTYLDVPLDEPSGTGSSETSPANKPWRMLMFILFLCLGLFVTLTVRTEFSTNAVTKVSSGNSEGVWKHVKEWQEDLKEWQEELKEQQEELKEQQEELKEQQEKLKKQQEKLKKQKEEVTEFTEEVKELKEKMEFLHPLSDRMPNFALESLGAKIIPHMTSESYPPEVPGLSLFGFQVISPKQPPPKSPSILLQGWAPKTSGQCWRFEGTRGLLTLELPYSITISHVSIGHIPKNISPDGTKISAPRMFSVIGTKHMDGPKIYLGTFEYDVEGRPLQMFEIKDQDTVVKFLSLEINTNWGNRKYTCIYSFRVHGKMAP